MSGEEKVSLRVAALRLWRSSRFWLLVLIASVIGVAFVLLRISQPVSIRIATGPKGGATTNCVQALRDAWDRDVRGVDIDPVEVKGTIESLERLHAPLDAKDPRGGLLAVDFAVITQTGTHGVRRDSGIRAVARLFLNPIEIIATKDSGITQLGDVASNHRIALQPEKTATAHRAATVLKHYGLRDLSRIVFAPNNVNEVAESLRDGDVDLAVFGGAMPLPAITAHLREGADRYRFVDIEFADAIELMHPPLFAHEIPPGAYTAHPPFPSRRISTVASYGILVARADVEDRIPRPLIYALTESLFSNRGTFVDMMPAMQLLSEDESGKYTGYPLLSGAHRYYMRSRPFNWELLMTILGIGVTVLCAVLSSVQVYRNRPKN